MTWTEVFYKDPDLFYETKYRIQKEMETQEDNIYPRSQFMFRAFRLTRFEKVRVVILGQDPYHNPGQANGLAFAVNKDIKIPPSLSNIFKEVESDIGKKPEDRTLLSWAKQGVLLLNTYLTVVESAPLSHMSLWEKFTDNVIQSLGEREEPMVFMLWGAKAKSKKQFITNPNHLILEAPHPSPFSVHKGFFGCKHFSQANTFLQEKYGEIIDWS